LHTPLKKLCAILKPKDIIEILAAYNYTFFIPSVASRMRLNIMALTSTTNTDTKVTIGTTMMTTPIRNRNFANR
jgi:hypothetical protein